MVDWGGEWRWMGAVEKRIAMVEFPLVELAPPRKSVDRGIPPYSYLPCEAFAHQSGRVCSPYTFTWHLDPCKNIIQEL